MREYHGMHGSRIYRIWQNMKNRCRNHNVQSYKHYGGRGIKVCKEWSFFTCFYKWAIANGYKDNLTLDRIDVNGDYCPSNCRFVTRAVQSRNRRNNIFINGKLLCDIATNKKEYTFLRDRIANGIPIDKPKKTMRRDITLKNETHSLREWARIFKINSGLLHYHLEKHGTKYVEDRFCS